MTSFLKCLVKKLTYIIINMSSKRKQEITSFTIGIYACAQLLQIPYNTTFYYKDFLSLKIFNKEFRKNAVK